MLLHLRLRDEGDTNPDLIPTIHLILLILVFLPSWPSVPLLGLGCFLLSITLLHSTYPMWCALSKHGPWTLGLGCHTFTFMHTPLSFFVFVLFFTSEFFGLKPIVHYFHSTNVLIKHPLHFILFFMILFFIFIFISYLCN